MEKTVWPVDALCYAPQPFRVDDREANAMELALFWVFAALCVLGALTVVLVANPVRGAMALVGTLFCIAVIFVLLQAHLIAVLEVLVYAGAVMVLFTFVIMLLNLREEELGARRVTFMKTLSFAAALGIGAMLAKVVSNGGTAPATSAGFGTVEEVGKLLLDDYQLAFELASVLLLVAIVGAVLVSKRKV